MRTVLDEPCPPGFLTKKKTARPRLGFLGVGRIGRNRLEAIAGSEIAEVTAIADTSHKCCEEILRIQPGTMVLDSLDDLLEVGLDGVVIATPSALHAEQAVTALERGVAVFCQKPLGRNAAETRLVIDAARANDRLLGVDLSYRFLTGARKIHELCRSGALGDIYAVDLIFHNAYGPDKAWFYDRKLSGGGCVIDLGIHLVDLAFWNLDFPEIARISSRLLAQGKSVHHHSTVEDYAIARIDLKAGAAIQLACSWKLPAGCDAIISASFYGTKGGAALHNVNGSFYEFTAQHFIGTKREPLMNTSESWGGCAAVDWANRLATGGRFNPDIEGLTQVAESLDGIYENAMA